MSSGSNVRVGRFLVDPSECEGSGGDFSERDEGRAADFATSDAVAACEVLGEECAGVGDVFAEAAASEDDFGGLFCHDSFRSFSEVCLEGGCNITLQRLSLCICQELKAASYIELHFHHFVVLTCMTQHLLRRIARLNLTIFPPHIHRHINLKTQPKTMPSEAQEKQASAAQARQVIDVFQEIATLLVCRLHSHIIIIIHTN